MVWAVGLLDDVAAALDDQKDALQVTQQEGGFTDDLALGFGDGEDRPKVNPQDINKNDGGINTTAVMTTGHENIQRPAATMANAATYPRINPIGRGCLHPC